MQVLVGHMHAGHMQVLVGHTLAGRTCTCWSDMHLLVGHALAGRTSICWSDMCMVVGHALLSSNMALSSSMPCLSSNMALSSSMPFLYLDNHALAGHMHKDHILGVSSDQGPLGSPRTTLLGSPRTKVPWGLLGPRSLWLSSDQGPTSPWPFIGPRSDRALGLLLGCTWLGRDTLKQSKLFISLPGHFITTLRSQCIY